MARLPNNHAIIYIWPTSRPFCARSRIWMRQMWLLALQPTQQQRPLPNIRRDSLSSPLLQELDAHHGLKAKAGLPPLAPVPVGTNGWIKPTSSLHRATRPISSRNTRFSSACGQGSWRTNCASLECCSHQKS